MASETAVGGDEGGGFFLDDGVVVASAIEKFLAWWIWRIRRLERHAEHGPRGRGRLAVKLSKVVRSAEKR